ncbi:hypothetical protein DMH17_02000 [Raoultella planticola]|nr:hypothetical protein [Raoultella planticola]
MARTNARLTVRQRDAVISAHVVRRIQLMIRTAQVADDVGRNRTGKFSPSGSYTVLKPGMIRAGAIRYSSVWSLARSGRWTSEPALLSVLWNTVLNISP